MAERPRGYGSSAENQDKIDAKFDSDQANEAFAWINEVFILLQKPDLAILPGDPGLVDVHNALCSGEILLELVKILMTPAEGAKVKVNHIKPGVPGVPDGAMKNSKKTENITKFLTACHDVFGVKTSDIFDAPCLTESTNIAQVISAIYALGRGSQKYRLKNNLDALPVLGPNEADKNVRVFTKEQEEDGKKVIGLQMGSNKGASQSGLSFGATRQIN